LDANFLKYSIRSEEKRAKGSFDVVENSLENEKFGRNLRSEINSNADKKLLDIEVDFGNSRLRGEEGPSQSHQLKSKHTQEAFNYVS
jgi:hypothetical protein